MPIVNERMHPGPFYESLFNCAATTRAYLVDADAQIVSRRQLVSWCSAMFRPASLRPKATIFHHGTEHGHCSIRA
jgi:hypothetical protein